jgi:hypothetical protein
VPMKVDMVEARSSSLRSGLTRRAGGRSWGGGGSSGWQLRSTSGLARPRATGSRYLAPSPFPTIPAIELPDAGRRSQPTVASRRRSASDARSLRRSGCRPTPGTGRNLT